jgi:hypothetical protein
MLHRVLLLPGQTGALFSRDRTETANARIDCCVAQATMAASVLAHQDTALVMHIDHDLLL